MTAVESLKHLHVLVVEDEALIVEELEERLTRLGATVVGSVDCAEGALRVAKETQPDVVLMDIRLRGDRDGISAANDIRTLVDVPVVFLTAHSDPFTLQRAKSSAPFGYVLKPFEERELIVAIEMAINRHALERRVRERERRYAETLASLGDGVIATDIGGRIVFMNPTAEALTAWTLAEANGRPSEKVLRLSRTLDDPHYLDPLADAIRTGAPCRFDAAGLFLISRIEEAIPVDACAAPITDARGRVTGGVLAFRDVRDRRLAEDAVKRALEELFQAEKMASVGRLAAGIAHDFNNLLTVINGCTDLALVDPSLSEETRGLLTNVVKAGTRAASITQQFLAFGQREFLRCETLDLNILVTRLNPMLRRLTGERISIAMELCGDAVPAYADPRLVEQIIVNLVVNARDAMPDGGRITVATGVAELDGVSATDRGVEPGRYAVVSVGDTGIGIPEAIRERIFEPYFTTKDVDKGTGLGLATVYGIAKQSGGSVTVDSTPGVGATFTVYLPATSASGGR